MFNLAVAIEIPCYFDQNSGPQISGWNNMGSLWEDLNWTLVDLHNITFSNSQDPNKDILEGISILFVEVLNFLNKPLFWCWPTGYDVEGNIEMKRFWSEDF